MKRPIRISTALFGLTLFTQVALQSIALKARNSNRPADGPPYALSVSLPQAIGSSEGTMEGTDLRRTAVYKTKGVPQLNSPVLKSERVFVMQDWVKETYFSNNIQFMGIFEYNLPTYFDFSEPVLANGVIYFATYIGDGYLIAVDTATGRGLWNFKVNKAMTSAPALAGNMAFIGANDGNFYVIDARTGKEQWRFKSGDRGFALSSPAISNGIAYFGSLNGTFYALDLQTHTEKWAFKTKGILTAAAISADRVFFGSEKGQLWAVNMENGLEVWNLKFNGSPGTPVIGDDAVYFRTTKGETYAVDIKTGRQKWKVEAGKAYSPYSALRPDTPLALNEDTLYFGAENKLYAVSSKTGELKWEFRTKHSCRPPVIADGIVYVGSYGHLYAVDATNGRQKWDFEATSKVKDKTVTHMTSSPAISNGMLYAVSDAGYVYALK